MMETYIRIVFDRLEDRQREELIARLAVAGFEGFEETDGALDAFIPQSEFDIDALQEIAGDLAYGVEEIEPRNWNAVWESDFQPVQVGSFALIRANFHAPVKGVQHDIIITPKMSFGTGHHATTSMMVEQMEELDFRHKTVFDFGTGTGILAILAEKCGAERVVAIDNDEWSITNAKENIDANNCTKIQLARADSPVSECTCDIILANINRNVLLENMHTLVDLLARKGILLLSGIMTSDENDMVTCLQSYGMHLVDKKNRGQWLCLEFSRLED